MRGYSEEEAKKFIHEIQKQNSKNSNDHYSVDAMMQKGYSKEEAEEIVKKRLKANPKRREHYNSEEEFRAALKKFADVQRELYKQNVKGYHSSFSKNFYKYQGLSDEEKLKRIRKIGFCKDNPNFDNFKHTSNSTTLEYYLNQRII